MLAFANWSFGVSEGAEERREGKGQRYLALTRSAGDEVKLARLDPAGSVSPGHLGRREAVGRNGRPGPHLLNRAWTQAAPGLKGLAEQFVFQPRGICWWLAPCGKARGDVGARRPERTRLQPKAGSTLPAWARRAAQSPPFGQGSVEGFVEEGTFKPLWVRHDPERPQRLSYWGLHSPRPKDLIFVPNGWISGAAKVEVSRGQRMQA